MRKQVFGKKLKRDANERKALLKGLMTDLVLKERITTTHEKAQAIRSGVEKLVTKAKRKGKDAQELLMPYLSAPAYEKVMNDLAKRFANRPGGYTRIVKLGARFGDNARMSVIEWVVGPEDKKEKAVKVEKVETKAANTKKTTSKKVAKTTKAKQK